LAMPEVDNFANSKEYLYLRLCSLGSYFPLTHLFRPREIKTKLEAFENDWKTYNPAKPGLKRQGLSLTSLDGNLSGVPDLTSLMEYNKQNGTSYKELDFRTLTPVYKACSELAPLIEPLAPYLGRSHFLRFEMGGFFPFHRDAYGGVADSFRIFVPLYTHSSRDFFFFLGDTRLNMEVGRPYFINTRIEHALFVLDGPSVGLVLNVAVVPESIRAVESMIFSK
jgi:hypothetical protein